MEAIKPVEEFENPFQDYDLVVEINSLESYYEGSSRLRNIVDTFVLSANRGHSLYLLSQLDRVTKPSKNVGLDYERETALGFLRENLTAILEYTFELPGRKAPMDEMIDILAAIHLSEDDES